MKPHLSILLLTSFVALSSIEANVNQQVTAMFVFGDSLSDNGNNIYFLATLSKGNYFPYGIDFEKGPTGRFSNGKIIVDYIGELLGLPLLPSYADSIAKGDDVMSGVNYASAGAGMIEETGRNFGRVIPLREQIKNFKNTLDQLRGQMQAEDLSSYLAKAVAFVDVGANDYLNNYLLPEHYITSSIYNPEEYADLLIKLYTGYIVELQNLGLRKFVIVGVAPIGCIPDVTRTSHVPTGECEPTSNNLVQMFNSRLKHLVNRLNSDNPAGPVFTNVASFDIFIELRKNADVYGFTVIDKSCCAVPMAMTKGKPVCLPNVEPCYNRDQYLFWDAAHPTDTANQMIANRIYNSSTYCYPVTIQKLAEI